MLRAFLPLLTIHLWGTLLLLITFFQILPGSYLVNTWKQIWNTGSVYNTQNQAPVVKIVFPADGSEHREGTMIRYQIAVTDREDGASEFGEIQPQMVLLEATMLAGTQQANQYQANLLESERDPPGLGLIKSSGCFNCHNDKTSLVGPSWQQLAQRYTPDPATLQTLANHVIHGSKGNWGEEPMPANPDLSTRELAVMIAYILNQGARVQSCVYAGLEGSVQLTDPMLNNDDHGVYVLTASYTDSGIDGDSSTRKRGQHSIMVKVVP
jgi:cytochrome c